MWFERLLQKDIELTNRLRLTNPKSRLKPFAISLAHSGDSWFILLALLVLWLLSDVHWQDRKSTRLNSSHAQLSPMQSSA